jgi:hypothetical protein
MLKQYKQQTTNNNKQQTTNNKQQTTNNNTTIQTTNNNKQQQTIKSYPGSLAAVRVARRRLVVGVLTPLSESEGTMAGREEPSTVSGTW